MKVFSSASTLDEKSANSPASCSLIRPTSAFCASVSLAPWRTKLAWVRWTSRCCSAVRPEAARALLIASMRANSFGLKVILL
jgi:hypothetical protein